MQHLRLLRRIGRRAAASLRGDCARPALAQLEIALIAGLARETASRTLSKLRSRGTVSEESGRLRLADLQPLEKRGLLL